MCIEGCSARRFIVQCEQRVVVVEGAPLAADATACVPSPASGGVAARESTSHRRTYQNVNIYTCEHLKM